MDGTGGNGDVRCRNGKLRVILWSADELAKQLRHWSRREGSTGTKGDTFGKASNCHADKAAKT